MANSIADQVSLCLRAFESFVVVLSSHGDSAIRDTSSAAVDNLDKFKIWTGNIGAHRRGQSSLDYRLRDASHIQQTVLQFLSRLQSSLAEAFTTASGERPILEKPSDSKDDSDSDDGYIMTPEMELKQIGAVIRETIRCLLRLSMTIQNPASHDRYMNGLSIDTSYFEAFDTQHVGAKYPEADSFLCQRLGRAISIRRQFLKYSENHRRRLKAGLDDTGEDSQSTVASSLATDHKIGMSESQIDEDDRVSRTSFATTVANSDKLRVPPLPREAEYGEEFECPLCYCIISVLNWIGWKRHVFNDLQPYVCIAGDCKTPNKIFSQRGTWHDHVRQESSALSDSTVCPLCLRGFPSARAWRSHLGKEMQQLALFAVPSHLYGLDNDDFNEIEEGSLVSGAAVFVSSEDSPGSHDVLDASEASQEFPEGESSAVPDPVDLIRDQFSPSMEQIDIETPDVAVDDLQDGDSDEVFDPDYFIKARNKTIEESNTAREEAFDPEDCDIVADKLEASVEAATPASALEPPKEDPVITAIKKLLLAQEKREKEKAAAKEKAVEEAKKLAEEVVKKKEDKLDTPQEMITEYNKLKLEWEKKLVEIKTELKAMNEDSEIVADKLEASVEAATPVPALEPPKEDPEITAIKKLLLAQEKREKEKAAAKEKAVEEAKKLAEVVARKEVEDKLDALQKMIIEHNKLQLGREKQPFAEWEAELKAKEAELKAKEEMEKSTEVPKNGDSL